VITLSLLLAQAVANLSLSQVQELSPEAAGDAILSGQQHGPIETFETPTGGMPLPGMIDGKLVERPTIVGLACVRRVWTVKFRAKPGADIATAQSERTYSSQEVMLPTKGICPSGRYVHLNPGVDVDQGREALTKLYDVSALTSRTVFRCSDETSSGLCKGNKAVGAAIRGMKPWAITSRDGDILIWLGEAGNTVTEVRFKSGQLSQVFVQRRIPAPF
jgi:hypothetical protein